MEYEDEPICFIKTVPLDFITLPIVSAESKFEKIIAIKSEFFNIIVDNSDLFLKNILINIRNYSEMTHRLIYENTEHTISNLFFYLYLQFQD